MVILRILTLSHTMPDVKSYRTILFEDLLPILKTKTNVHITWLIYKPEKLNLPSQEDPDTTILDIHDYNNAVEVVQKVKPDIIYVLPGLNAPDYALSLAGKFLHIPVVGGELGNVFFTKKSRIGLIISYINQFFQRSVPTDTNENQKQLMRRGRFFIYKHIFLLRTFKAVKMDRLKILSELFILFRMYFGLEANAIYSKFACTLHFLDNENMMKRLADAGVEKSSLVVTGNPTYDVVFKRLQKFKSSIRKDDKIRILLVTINLPAMGERWTKRRRDSAVKGIVTEIYKHKEEMSLVVKIHPTSEVLSEYQSLINPIDPSVLIYQKEDIVDLLEMSDVIIGTSASTAILCALIAKKPIIIHNCFNVDNDVFLENGLALECKQLSKLVTSIYDVLSSNPASPEKVENFIRGFLYSLDGCASERISHAIMELLGTKERSQISNLTN